MLHTFSRNYIIPAMSHHPPCIHKYLNMWPLKKLKCQHSCTHIFVRAVNYHLTLFLTTTAIAYSKTSFQLVILKAVLALLSLFVVRLYVCSFEWIVYYLQAAIFLQGILTFICRQPQRGMCVWGICLFQWCLQMQFYIFAYLEWVRAFKWICTYACTPVDPYTHARHIPYTYRF